MITLDDARAFFCPPDAVGAKDVVAIEGSPDLKAGLALAFEKKTGKDLGVLEQAWFKIVTEGYQYEQVQVGFRNPAKGGPIFWSDPSLWATPELVDQGFAYYAVVNELEHLL